MNWKLVAAVVVGLVTAGLLYIWTQSVKNEQTAYAFMQLLPDHAVARGQHVTPDMLGDPVMLPASFGTLANLAVPQSQAYDEWLRDRTAAADIPAGSVLLFQYFDDQDGGRLTTMIAPGKRALTLPVDATGAVGHFVEPGSRVDILGTVDEPLAPIAPNVPQAAEAPGASPAPAGTAAPPTAGPPAAVETPPASADALLKSYIDQYAAADPGALTAYQKQTQDFQAGISERTRIVTRTFLQNVKVLAVGAATTPDAAVATGDNYSHVTVEVTPAEAEMLIFAMRQANGQLNLALRNPADEKIETLPSVNWTRM